MVTAGVDFKRTRRRGNNSFVSFWDANIGEGVLSEGSEVFLYSFQHSGQTNIIMHPFV